MIFVLPGMGADSSFFRNEWRTLPDCIFANWPIYRGERTLTEIAQRLVDERNIRDGCLVVGHSLGGMVACEVAKLRRLRSVILISSAVRREEVSKMARLLHRLAPVTPLEGILKLAAWLTSDTARMFGRSDPRFIRASADAIFEWEGADPEQAPLKRIHGTWDTVIPMPSQADLVLRGGHLLPKTHTRECVDFVRSML